MGASELLPRFLQDRATLARSQVEADRVIAAALAGHLVHDLRRTVGRSPDRPWRLDPIPYLLDGPAFDALAVAVRQRMEAIELVLADLYGPRRLLREAWIPAEVLASSPRYRVTTVGAPPPRRWLTSYALDTVALADGSWRVVQDLTDTPTGVGFALLDRSVMARVAAELLGAEGARDVASITAFPAELRHALTSATTTGSPRVVLFTGGVDEPAYVEHSALARQLGFHLVEGPDLVVRQGRLWLRTVSGLEPIDVVYRRLSDVAIDPIEAGSVGADGVPGLLFAAAEHGVVLANAHGTGVIEDPDLAPCWPAATEGLAGIALGLSALAPHDALARVPSFVDGQVQFAAVVVRLHAVASDDGVTVMAGGNGRVLADGDDPRRPTARLAKDVWVLGAGRVTPVLIAPPLPQVDLGASVPTRAADALFLAGRSAERAEAIARTARVVAARRLEDPLLVALDGGRWARRTAAALRTVTGAGGALDDATTAPLALIDGELRAASAAVVDNVATLIGEATSVGEYLSVTAGRVLRSLGQVTEGQGADRRPRRHDRRPRRAGRAVEREHGARPGVAVRGHRPPGRAGARGARPHRVVRRAVRSDRRHRPVRAGGRAGSQREPRRLPAALPQRRRARSGRGAAAARPRQPAVVRRVHRPAGRPRRGHRVGRRSDGGAGDGGDAGRRPPPRPRGRRPGRGRRVRGARRDDVVRDAGAPDARAGDGVSERSELHRHGAFVAAQRRPAHWCPVEIEAAGHVHMAMEHQ